MPRSPRQDHEGAWQHVMNRGFDRKAVFRSDDDRQIFYDCLAAAMPRYGVQVHAWCLLDNHFHLLLLSERSRLSDAMRFLARKPTPRCRRSMERLCHGVRPAGSDPIHKRRQPRASIAPRT
jgi:putative transposase